MDLDRGFSPPDYFHPFPVFGQAFFLKRNTRPKITGFQNPSQNPSFLAEKSIAKSVTVTRKIHPNSTQLRRDSLRILPTMHLEIVLRKLSCTRLRVPSVALHVSQLISWILERFAGVAPVWRYTPKNFGVAPFPPPCAGRCRTGIWV